eukprot:914218_1
MPQQDRRRDGRCHNKRKGHCHNTIQREGLENKNKTERIKDGRDRGYCNGLHESQSIKLNKRKTCHNKIEEEMEDATTRGRDIATTRFSAKVSRIRTKQNE